MKSMLRHTAGSRTAAKTGRGILFLVWLMALASGLCSGCPLLAQPQGPMVMTFRVGIQRSSFTDVNPNDLAGSFKVLTQTIAKQRNIDLKPAVQIYEKWRDLEAAMKSGEVRLAIVGSWDYLGLDRMRNVEPAFVHVNDNHVLQDYLVLTKRGSGLNTPADLKGKDLLLLERPAGLLAEYWLDTRLADEHLGPKDVFFRKVEVVRKPTAAVLPVFFGNRQTCIVDRAAYAILVEMNPQIITTLQVIDSSLPYLNSIACMSKEGWPSEQIKNDFWTALKDLHLTPEGRQILLLFKVDRLEPFAERFLESVAELRLKHKRPSWKPKP